MRKQINGYNNYYIYDNGDVLNISTNKILKGSIGENGYKYYRLSKDNNKTMFYAHRLVAEHFLENPNSLPVVNHKDGNKLNNKAENLEWVTRSENDLHAYEHNLRTAHPCQFKHKIIAINKDTLETVKIYNNVQECCDDLHVARSNIYNCCNGKQKTCKGYILRYEE